MSAPNPGRNSPEPRDQSDAQQQGVLASGNLSDSSAAKDTHHQQDGEQKQGGNEGQGQELDRLESNPSGPLEDAARAKLAKGSS